MVGFVGKSILEIQDAKCQKNLFTAIFEETFSKKPYAKHLTLALLENELPTTVFDTAKLARECLKNLTSEDLVQLHIAANMSVFEERYTNIEGTAVENELAKIVLRYVNEGKAPVREQVEERKEEQVEEI